MSIKDQIQRLSDAKSAIKTSIENKGVIVDDSATLDKYPSLIDSIEVGGGGTCDPMYSIYECVFNTKTKNNTYYYELFKGYTGVEIPVNSLNTSNVTTMYGMFYNCSKLTQLDLSSFDTSNVTNMYSMFYNCTSLTSIDGLSNFDTSNVTSMYELFSGCQSLTSLDLSSFDTSNVNTMQRMFASCQSLTTLDVSSFDTSNVTNMSNMFYNCSKLTQLDLSNFDTSNVTNMSMMFSYCTALTSLDMSNCDVSKCTSSSAFSNTFGSNSSNSCIALTDFKAPKNISANISFQYCTALTHDSLMSIINNLATVTSTKTLTLGTTNLAKLSSEEVAIATNKGWTVK